MIAAPLVPVLGDKRLRSWPKSDSGGCVTYVPPETALTQDYDTDAHMAAYSVPDLERRLSLDALRQPGARARLAAPVPMVLAIVDVDCTQAHAGDLGAVDDWWIDELQKVLLLLATHPGAFVYRTRGGYRIVYRLSEPILLKDDADAQAWSHRYCTWVAYLNRQFQIAADPACHDWTRLFRVPHATRDPEQGPERREVIGDPAQIGAWDCSPSPEDATAAEKMRRRPSKRRKKMAATANTTAVVGDGVLFHLLNARSMVGSAMEPGKWAAACPNEAAHTSGETFDSSTILYAPGPGEAMGWLHRSHAHCTHMTLRDVLAGFTNEELITARAAAGLPTARPADPETAAAPLRDDFRPRVYVPGPHTGEDEQYFEVGTNDFTRAVLAAFPADQLYRMDSVVGCITGTPGARRFAALDHDAARQVIDAHVRLVQGSRDRRTDELITIYKACTRDLASLVLSAAQTHTAVRDLSCIVHFPVYLPGFQRAEPGWNEAGGVYYDEPDDLRDLTPQPQGALGVLADLYVDFPYKDEASRSNMYGAMLTVLMRPAIEGPIPFNLLLASLERTGKGKAIDTGPGMAVTGSQVPLLQLSPNEEEREKRITSEITGGTTVLHFDNIPGGSVLDSPSLASLCTAWPRWRGRLLGKSQMVSLPNRLVVFLSGNNVKATGELCKRTVPIVLESATPTPELRDDFVHPDILGYASSRRRNVLAALLGLIEDWIADGRPGTRVRMGGFERWAECIGGILSVAGATAWMSNYRAWVVSADDEGADAEILVERWADLYRTEPITATQILTMIEDLGIFSRVLAVNTEAGRKVSVGRRVIPVVLDRPTGAWVVRRAGCGSSSKYFLAPGIASTPAKASSHPPDGDDAWGTL